MLQCLYFKLTINCDGIGLYPVVEELENKKWTFDSVMRQIEVNDIGNKNLN